MKWKPIIIWTACIAAAGTGVYYTIRYFKKQKVLLKDYGTELIGIKFSSFNEDLITIEFTVRVQNKSDIEATISSLYADIYLNNAFIGNIVNNGQFVVPKKGFSDIKVNFSFSSKLILKSIVSSLLAIVKANDVPYRLKGYVNIKSGGIPLPALDFDYSGYVNKDMLGK